MRSVPDCAINFIKSHEGLKLTASADIGGAMDAGYGHDEPTLKPGQQITERQAELWLQLDLNTAATRLSKVVEEPVILALTDNQYGALLSFVFNLGCQPGWTIWKVLNARDFDHVPEQMMRFVYCKGKKVQGLVNRRAAEVQLWSTEEPGSIPDQPSSAVTRAADTPPLPAQPALSTGHVIAGCVAAAGGVAEGAKQVTQIIQPYADKSDLVQHALSYAATAGAAAAVAVAFLMWLQHRQAKT
jgi:lysozyme